MRSDSKFVPRPIHVSPSRPSSDCARSAQPSYQVESALSLHQDSGRAPAPRNALHIRGPGARPEVSQRILKEQTRCASILILRQDRPTPASLSGSCLLLRGVSSITLGSFCQNQADEGVSSRPFPRRPRSPLFGSTHGHLDHCNAAAPLTAFCARSFG